MVWIQIMQNKICLKYGKIYYPAFFYLPLLDFKRYTVVARSNLHLK